jgi:hypothetical protein
MSRFEKGRSGNPQGRPTARRPHVSAFDIIFDQVLTVTQGGIEREFSVDEALQLQTYQAALKGSKMAIRAVLKMIEKREAALTKLHPPVHNGPRIEFEANSANADDALRILGIARDGQVPPGGGEVARTLKLENWAAQAAISRPGRRRFTDKDREDVERYSFEPGKLRWTRGKNS